MLARRRLGLVEAGRRDDMVVHVRHYLSVALLWFGSRDVSDELRDWKSHSAARSKRC